MSQESATTNTVPRDREGPKYESEEKFHDAGHDEQLLENAPQALHEPAVNEGQEALQVQATSKDEDEHPRDDEELVQNAPQVLREPAVSEGQEALQVQVTAKNGDERDGENNLDGAIIDICDKVQKTLAELQEYRRELELRIPVIREAFLAKMGEVFDQSLEQARAQWNALHAEIWQVVYETREVMQRIEELQIKRDALKGSVTDAWDTLG